MGRGQTAEVSWRNGRVPASARFDDPYFSLENGLEETRHVFLAGNDLPARLEDGFQVAELGFGTGLNLLALAEDWRGPGLVRFTSFEAFPMPADDLERALAAFPDLPGTADLGAAWRNGYRHFRIGMVEVQVIEGDARDTLPQWTGRADAWFLDGFAPAKNPELWDEALLAAVANHTHPHGTIATYTAAGHVRRALAAAGFAVERRPGYGRKRHMTAGRLR